MVKLWKIVLQVIMAVFVVGICTVGVRAEAAESKLDTIVERGYIMVGTTGDYKPMSYLNKNTGKYEGFDV